MFWQWLRISYCLVSKENESFNSKLSIRKSVGRHDNVLIFQERTKMKTSILWKNKKIEFTLCGFSHFLGDLQVLRTIWKAPKRYSCHLKVCFPRLLSSCSNICDQNRFEKQRVSSHGDLWICGSDFVPRWNVFILVRFIFVMCDYFACEL